MSTSRSDVIVPPTMGAYDYSRLPRRSQPSPSSRPTESEGQQEKSTWVPIGFFGRKGTSSYSTVYRRPLYVQPEPSPSLAAHGKSATAEGATIASATDSAASTVDSVAPTMEVTARSPLESDMDMGMGEECIEDDPSNNSIVSLATLPVTDSEGQSPVATPMAARRDNPRRLLPTSHPA
jgi:hypothetical protein